MKSYDIKTLRKQLDEAIASIKPGVKVEIDYSFRSEIIHHTATVTDRSTNAFGAEYITFNPPVEVNGMTYYKTKIDEVTAVITE